MTVRIVVLGRPLPGGSKRPFAIRAAGQLTGRFVVTDSNPRVGAWKQQIAATALATVNADGNGWQPLAGPIALDVLFILRRPVGHYRSGRHADELRPTAPKYPHVRPDATKLLRPLEDALTGVVWRDDAQIVSQHVRKRYGHPEGAEITVQELTP